MKTYTPIILPLLILLYSCAGTKPTNSLHRPKYEAKLDSFWVGKSKHDVYIEFGVPNRVIDDGEYGIILAYDKIDIHNRTETITTTEINREDYTKNKRSETVYPTIFTTVNSTQFFINKLEKVYKCKYFKD